MRREPFLELVREAMDSLPRKFRKHIQNVAVVVEDYAPEGRDPNDLVMGIFEGTPHTERSLFGADTGPNRIVLYQKNIEARAEDVASEEGRSVEEIIREEVRLTVLHEFGYYFGLDEEALEDVYRQPANGKRARGRWGRRWISWFGFWRGLGRVWSE